MTLIHDLLLVFGLWAVSGFLSIISFPVCSALFPRFADKGYGLAKIVGPMVISYLVFWTATVGVLPLSYQSNLIVVGSWIVVNLAVAKKFGVRKTLPWRQMVLDEAIFIVLTVLLVVIRGHQPEIFQIERFMDFGFIQALFNSNKLPLADIWMAGKSLNYYYFGHVVGYVLISLMRVPVVSGFYLVEAWIFGVLGVASFNIGQRLFAKMTGAGGWTSVAAGLLSLFGVLFAGTWHTAWWQIKNWAGLFEQPFWYPEPTRIIPGTITEIPIYSFLVAELHAHMWGMLTGVVIVGLLVEMAQGQWRGRKGALYCCVSGFVLGVAAMINSWDVLSLGGLVALGYGVFNLRQNGWNWLVDGMCLFGFVVVTALPWLAYFHSPLGGVGLVTSHSPVDRWLLFWGQWVVLGIVFAGKVLWDKLGWAKTKDRFGLPLVLVGYAGVLLVAVEIFFFKDVLIGGEWMRANTVFKLGIQTWLLFGLASGPMVVYLIVGWKNVWLRIVMFGVAAAFIGGLAVYPIKAVGQASWEGRQYTGIGSGLTFWQMSQPNDFAAYKYLAKLRDNLPEGQKLKVILEAEGESYTDNSAMSVFLGWPTVAGWAVHEWTWRGSFDEIGKRGMEVRNFYMGDDRQFDRQFIRKYKIDYVMVGEVEGKKYGASLKRDKIRGMGTVVFDNGNTFVVALKDNLGS